VSTEVHRRLKKYSIKSELRNQKRHLHGCAAVQELCRGGEGAKAIAVLLTFQPGHLCIQNNSALGYSWTCRVAHAAGRSKMARQPRNTSKHAEIL
jgi:hypothetical protein